MAAKDGTPIVREGPLPGDGSLTGTIAELANPGSTYKRRAAADDAKCLSYGFKLGTDAYSNCRVQMDQMRTQETATAARIRRQQDISDGEQSGRVYNATECIGPVIMGRCEGSIIPNGAYHPTCHGDWLNGQCTGPMF